ncbi:MAG: 50S ribosomal protein L30 [Pseudomonadota bacterium]
MKAAPKKAPQAVFEGQVKVTQLGSPIGRTKDQAATLIGLGLGKRHRSRVLANSAEVQGMIRAVQHLIKVEKA